MGGVGGRKLGVVFYLLMGCVTCMRVEQRLDHQRRAMANMALWAGTSSSEAVEYADEGKECQM